MKRQHTGSDTVPDERPLSDLSTAPTVHTPEGAWERFVAWLLLTGSRGAVTALVVGSIVGTVAIAIGLDLISIGADSQTATVFASGLTAGTFTLVTVALSINQLILSRVFGSPNELLQRLDGSRDLRERVRSYSGVATTPTDLSGFLALTGRTLRDRADRLDGALRTGEWAPPQAVDDYVDDVGSYGGDLDDLVSEGDPLSDSLDAVIGAEYAENLGATEAVRYAYGDRFPTDAAAEIEAIDDLLESIAVTRQFLKTVMLQQNFARLSRVLAYTGTFAVVTSAGTTALYLTDTITLDPETFPLVFLGIIAVVFLPLAAFIAYLLRAATVGYRTVTVGPFAPPG